MIMENLLTTYHPFVEVGVVFAVLAGCLLVGWFKYWQAHARKFAQSGYTPPPTGWAGKLTFKLVTRLLTFLTVGRVTVVNRYKSPLRGRVIFAANHQLPCDFAMLRHGANRHFRMLTAADQLTGAVGLLGAFMGVISVAFKQKSDGVAAETACVNAVAEDEGSLGIFPEGALLPDNPNLSENFRPGAVRIARAAALASGSPVHIVPIAIFYKHDRKQADWTHRFFKRTRSMFLGTRNPRNFDPIFKESLEGKTDVERAQIEAIREAKLRGYRQSRVTNYGGVVVVGEAIDIRDLPEDPIEAINKIRDAVAGLLEEAKKH